MRNFINLAGYSVYKKQNRETAQPNSPFAFKFGSKGEQIPVITLNPKVATNTAYISSDFLYHDKNFWDYYYDKDGVLHFDREIDFGTITGETIIKFKIQNDDTKNRILRDINFSSNDNINIYGAEIGKSFKPMEWIEITLQTDINGNATINTNLNFVFDNQIITIHIMGVRAVVWTYLPNLVYKESKELKTDVFTSQNATEKRIQKRTKFIRAVSFDLTTDEIAKNKGVANLLIFAQKSSFLVPLWLSAVIVDKDEINSLTIQTSDTANSEFKVGGYVLIWRSFDKWDFAKLQSLGAKTIKENSYDPKTGKMIKNASVKKAIFTLEKGVGVQKGDLVMPLITATPKTAINSDFLTGKVGTYNLEFTELL